MLHMNDFVEREWSHMQSYLQRISTIDIRLKLAAAEYPSIDVGKELGMLHALLVDELKSEVAAGGGGSASSAPVSAAAAAQQQPQMSAAVVLPPPPLDGLRALLLRVSEDLTSPRVLSTSFSAGGPGGNSSLGGQTTPTVAPTAAAAAAVTGARPAAAASADALASPTNDYVEFAWRQPPKPGAVVSAAAVSAAGWLVHAGGSESGAKATNTNETRSTAKPVEVAEQPVAFTSPASMRAVELPAAQSTEVRRRDNSAPQAVGRHPARQQHALSGDYVDLVTMPNGSTAVFGAHDDDLPSSVSSSSRTATPSSGYASFSAAAAGDDFAPGSSSSSGDGSLGLSGALHKTTPTGAQPSELLRKELYGSNAASPALTRAAAAAAAAVAAQAAPPRTTSSAAPAAASSVQRQQPPSPLVFINPGYQRRPSAGGPLPSRSTRRPAAAGYVGAGQEEQPALLSSPSVVAAQASPAVARFQTLPNRYGSQSVKSNKTGPVAKPDAGRSGVRPVQPQQQPPLDESRSGASTRSDQAPSLAARVYKSMKGVDVALLQSSPGSPPLQCRAVGSGSCELSSCSEAVLAVRDEKRYGCAAFPVADLDSPAQVQRGAKGAAGGVGGGGGSATLSRRSEQLQQQQRVRAHSASSADDRGGDGSGGETPPSDRSWSSSQGSFNSTSARTIQRKLEEHEYVKKEHEGIVETLKSQLEEAQRRLEETEERLAKQAEQTTSAMSEWRLRLDASEAKLYAQQKEKDVQMQAILDRLHCVEKDLRREQQEMKGSILQRQRMIELQERRIEQLDAANARLLGSLQQLKEEVGGGGGELKAAAPVAAGLVLPAAGPVAPPAAAGERQQAVLPQQQQTTYKTILYYSHDAGKTGFV